MPQLDTLMIWTDCWKPLRLIRDGDVGGGGDGLEFLHRNTYSYNVTTRMILH